MLVLVGRFITTVLGLVPVARSFHRHRYSNKSMSRLDMELGSIYYDIHPFKRSNFTPPPPKSTIGVFGRHTSGRKTPSGSADCDILKFTLLPFTKLTSRRGLKVVLLSSILWALVSV